MFLSGGITAGLFNSLGTSCDPTPQEATVNTHTVSLSIAPKQTVEGTAESYFLLYTVTYDIFTQSYAMLKKCLQM